MTSATLSDLNAVFPEQVAEHPYSHERDLGFRVTGFIKPKKDATTVELEIEWANPERFKDAGSVIKCTEARCKALQRTGFIDSYRKVSWSERVQKTGKHTIYINRYIVGTAIVTMNLAELKQIVQDHQNRKTAQ